MIDWMVDVCQLPSLLEAIQGNVQQQGSNETTQNLIVTSYKTIKM